MKHYPDMKYNFLEFTLKLLDLNRKQFMHSNLLVWYGFSQTVHSLNYIFARKPIYSQLFYFSDTRLQHNIA